MASRSKLVGKQVYNPNGTLVGTVQDVVLPVGEGEISLQVLSKYRTNEVVQWTDIGAAADILILKKAIQLKVPTIEEAANLVQPVQPAESGGMLSRITGKSGKPESAQKCPTCGGNLRWIKQYKRWYCDSDKKYV